MYQFRITKQENGGFRFELNGIKMFIDDYILKDDKHLLKNPHKAIAYFDVENNLYGVSNDLINFGTAEEFHDAMARQFRMFATDK